MKNLFTTLSLVLFFTQLTSALYLDIGKPCKGVRTRKEWRTLSDTEKKAYIAAVLKFQKQSDPEGTKGAAYYARVHFEWGSDDVIHGGAQFLPWHRYCTLSYEADLRAIDPTICQHYWYAPLDYADFWSAPVFQASDTSFGTIGEGPDNCVRNGPFKDMKPYIDKCLSRYSDPNKRVVIDSPSSVHDLVTGIDNYVDFNYELESGFHARVHIATGGVMYETFRSPNEPLFFLHHANVDRLWAEWQKLDPQRYREYGGNGDKPDQESLDSLLYKFNKYKVRDVMRIDKLCYKYAEPPQVNLRRRDTIPSPPVSATTTPSASKKGGADEVCLGELVGIPYPIDIPDSWIIRNHGDVNRVHKHEAMLHKKIDELNSLEGFVSFCSPVKREDLLARLIQRRQGNARRLSCYFKGEKVVVPVGKDANETAERLIGKFEEEWRNKRKPSVEELAAVIGNPLHSVNSAFSPFRACEHRE